MNDAVFQGDDGKWNFWDENAEPYFYGPYETEEEAQAAHEKYCATNKGSDVA